MSMNSRNNMLNDSSVMNNYCYDINSTIANVVSHNIDIDKQSNSACCKTMNKVRCGKSFLCKLSYIFVVYFVCVSICDCSVYDASEVAGVPRYSQDATGELSVASLYNKKDVSVSGHDGDIWIPMSDSQRSRSDLIQQQQLKVDAAKGAELEELQNISQNASITGKEMLYNIVREYVPLLFTVDEYMPIAIDMLTKIARVGATGAELLYDRICRIALTHVNSLLNVIWKVVCDSRDSACSPDCMMSDKGVYDAIRKVVQYQLCDINENAELRENVELVARLTDALKILNEQDEASGSSKQ